MTYPESLLVDTRRSVYLLTLKIYEAFEALPERGVLAQDIEWATNRILKLVASYSIKENKQEVLKDIIAELKGLRAMLGVVRDTSLLERRPSLALLKDTEELEQYFTDTFSSASEVTRRLTQPAGIIDIKTVDKHAQEPGSPAMSSNATMVVSRDKEIIISDNVLAEIGADGMAVEDTNHISKRQESIIEVLKRRPEISVGDLGPLFAGKASKKTLQRDLQELVNRKIVERRGDKRWAVYSLVAKS